MNRSENIDKAEAHARLAADIFRQQAEILGVTFDQVAKNLHEFKLACSKQMKSERQYQEKRAFAISKYTQFTAQQALDFYGLTGDWNEVRKWAELSNYGMPYESLLIAFTYGFAFEGVELMIKAMAE